MGRRVGVPATAHFLSVRTSMADVNLLLVSPFSPSPPTEERLLASATAPTPRDTGPLPHSGGYPTVGAVLAAGGGSDGFPRHIQSPPAPHHITIDSLSRRVAELTAYVALFPSSSVRYPSIDRYTSDLTSSPTSSSSSSVPATGVGASPTAGIARAVEVPTSSSSPLRLPDLPPTTSDPPILHSAGVGAEGNRQDYPLLDDDDELAGALRGVLGVVAGGDNILDVGCGCDRDTDFGGNGGGGGCGPGAHVVLDGGRGMGGLTVVGDGLDVFVGDFLCGRSGDVADDVRAGAVVVGFGGSFGDGLVDVDGGTGGDFVLLDGTGADGGERAGLVGVASGGGLDATGGGVRAGTEAPSYSTLAAAVDLVAGAMTGRGGLAGSTPLGRASPSPAPVGRASPSPPPSPALLQC